MSASRRSVSAYLSILFLVALALAVVGFDRHDTAPPQPAAALGGVPDLAGTWQGQWIDTVFAVTGPCTWSITQDATTVTLTGTNDLSALGPPLGSAEPLDGSGNIIGGGTVMSAVYQFTALSALTASGNFVIAGAGPSNMTGAGNTGLPLNFGPYQFILTATSSSISGIFFGFASGGAGTFEITKTADVDPESWAAVKEMYRE